MVLFLKKKTDKQICNVVKFYMEIRKRVFFLYLCVCGFIPLLVTLSVVPYLQYRTWDSTGPFAEFINVLPGLAMAWHGLYGVSLTAF